jgi:hypothetical protein
MNMKKIITLTVLAIASQAVAVFAGEPVVSSKQVIAPPPPPPPEYFRANEFDIGVFGTYAKVWVMVMKGATCMVGVAALT